MPAGPGPEFPLWLGLISLPLAFLGDLCWFPPPPPPVLGPLKKDIPQYTEEKVLGGSKACGPKCFGQPAMPMGLLYIRQQ